MLACTSQIVFEYLGTCVDTDVERLKCGAGGRSALVHLLQRVDDSLDLPVCGVSGNADLIGRIFRSAGNNRQMVTQLFQIGHRGVARNLQHLCALV